MSFHDRQIIRPVWPFALNHLSPQAQGLVAWWPMALPGGNTLFDLSGRGFNGALVNGPTWGADADGNSVLRFDGSDDYVSCGQVSITGHITLSVWVSLDALTFHRPFIAKRDDSLSNKVNYAFDKDNNNGEIRFYWHDGSQYIVYVSTNAALAINRWYHIVATYETGVTPNLYLNGVALNRTVQLGTGLPALVANAADTRLGSFVGASGDDQALSGFMRDVRIYNRALSDAEVYALFDPTTRYDLYWELGRRVTFLPMAGDPRKGDFFSPMTGF